MEKGAQALAAWFLERRRDLPWRRPHGDGNAVGEGPQAPRRDPYRVWIAEIMLQQTQVATVVPYFNRWMERFPDVRSLAAAGEEDVLAAWAGLGYYSRARNALATARELAGRGGAFPDTREGLLALKGVGEYTAGAIASLAFDKSEAILDGNLARVFSRLYGFAFLPTGKADKAAYWAKAREWAACHRPGLVNEGLIELGALVCTPRRPACGDCPLSGECFARSAGRQEDFPPAKTRARGVEVEGYAVAAFRKGRRGREVMLYTPRKDERLAGLLTFPFFPAADWKGLRMAWTSALPGLEGSVLKPRPGDIRHGITRYRYRLKLAEADVPAAAAERPLPAGYGWAAVEALDRTLVSSLPRKILRAIL